MKKFFTEMFNYDKWANDRIIAAIVTEGVKDPRIQELISHVLCAQEIWLNRILGIPPVPDENVWKIFDDTSIQKKADTLFDKWVQFINGYPVDTFTEIIEYRNSEGLRFENSLKDIVLHVINHGTHHRAQIAARLSHLGYKSPPVDYIFYKRMT